MDLKRAWRNGFLMSLLLAVRLYDLAFDLPGSPADPASEVPQQIPQSTTTALGPSDWDATDAHYHELSISNNSLKDMLLESQGAAPGDTIEASFQIDPEDLFQSFDDPGGIPQLRSDESLQIAAESIGPAPAPSFDFAGPLASTGAHNAPFASSPADLSDEIDADPTPISFDPESGNDPAQPVPEPSSLVLLAIGAAALALATRRQRQRASAHRF